MRNGKAIFMLIAAAAMLAVMVARADARGSKHRKAGIDGAIFSKNVLRTADGVRIYDVVYWSGGLRVKGKLFESEKRPAKPAPGVVFNHGGVGGIPGPTVARCKDLVRAGYVAFAPSYRGEDGSEGEIEVAAGEVDDALNAVKLLRKWPGVDAKRIGMAGTSHGGIITLLAVEREKLGAAVCAYGVSNTFTWYKYLVDSGNDVGDPLSLKVYGKGPADKPAAFEKRSPAKHADLINTPLMLIYGDEDKTVPISQGEEMAAALKRYNKKFVFVSVPGADHGFIFMNNPKKHSREQVETAEKSWSTIVKFLDENLKK